MATALETQLLYITYFGRPADPSGLNYWTSFPQSTLPLSQVADFFAADTEFADTTTGKTTSQIVNSFYVNAFGRQADASGLQYWVQEVDSGRISIQDVGLFIALGALAQPAGSTDRVALESKQAASQRWTGLVAADTTASLEYSGPLAATFGVDFLVPVTTAGTVPSQSATQAAIDGLPPVGTVGLLSSNTSSVNEGGTIQFTLETIPSLAGQTIAYTLSGIQAGDVVGGALSGSVLIEATGVGVIEITIAEDSLDEAVETLKINFPNRIIFARPPGSETVNIIDTTVPVLSAVAQPSAVDEGSILTFLINTTNIASGTVLTYNITGISSADVNGALLSGTRTVNSDGSVDPVVLQVSADLSSDGQETAFFSVSGGGAATATASSVINDTSVTPVPALQVQAVPSAVNEGSLLTFNITTQNIASGTVLTYALTGVSSSDVNNAPLSSTVVVDGSGNAVVQFLISADLTNEGPETATLSVVGGGAFGQASSVINDTSITPLPALQVQAVPSAVNEGATLTFNITTQNIAVGTVLTYVLSGVSSSDVNNAPLSSTVVVNGSGNAVVQFLISADLTTEGPETATLSVVGGGAFGEASSVINDTSVAPSNAVLTPLQDIVAGSAVSNFTFFGNEETLGQNDQLSRGLATFANLAIGTTGSFVLDNFSTDGIQTLNLTPSGESLADSGLVDLSRSTGGLVNINVLQSKLGTLKFDDIQSADGFRTVVSDTISTITYNFDANALTGPSEVSVILNETPIDATTGEAVGFDFTQGPTGADASIETLRLASLGVTGIKNVVDLLSVGDALEKLFITGTTDLEITTDLNSQSFLGLIQGNDNGRIKLIDAAALDAALTLSYTSELGDPSGADNSLFDVDVLGAVGSNRLTFGSTASPNPTDFRVKTQNSKDTVITVGGADSIDSGGGDDSVDAGDGSDTVVSASGNNTLIGGLGNDSIVSGIGNDLIFGDAIGKLAGDTFGTGNDTISSGAGNDTVFAGAGSNFVETGLNDDIVTLGEVTQNNDKLLGDIAGDTSPNTVLLGAGNDRLRIDTDSLTVADSINGGIGIDTIELHNGGTLLRSETLRTSQIEVLDLVGPGDYDITLSDELVSTSDDLGSRRFTVDASNDPAVGNVKLDLSFLSPVDGQRNLISIRYFGQADTDFERVIARDGLISDQLVIDFFEAPNDADDSLQSDVLQIVDSADVTKDDLAGLTESCLIPSLRP